MIGKLLSVKNTLHFLKKVVTIILFSFFFSGYVVGQEKTISGQITDKAGSALPGVNIVIKGTTNGVITDLNGNFIIKVPSGASLVITYVGYEEQEIGIGEQTNLNIQLAESIAEIDQVIVVGYGVQKKSDLTGAVASVSSEKLSKMPVAGLDQAMQGMAAGVNIIPQTGRPGGSVNVQIRGISSINGTKPLIVVDGVGQDFSVFSKINPDDVESIEILKDASSAAIYGASGGNGVILITTKKGKSGDISVTFNSYKGVEDPIKKLDMMNSKQWIEVMDEMSSSKKPFTTRPDTFETYDWQDLFFKQAITQNYDLSISGGNDKSKFLVSSSLNQQDGIIENTDNQRFTLRLNSDHKINKYITFDEKISYVSVVNEGFEDWEYQGYYQNPVMSALQMTPYLPAYDENGKWTVPYGGGTNPMVGVDMKDKTRRSDNYEGNFSLTIEPIKGLVYISRFTGGLSYKDDKEYKAIYNATATDSRSQNELIQKMERGKSWNLQNIVSYTNTLFSNHNFMLMAGQEANRYWGYDINGTRVDMPSDVPEMLYPSMSSNDTLDKQALEGSGYEGRSFRYFGRLNYDYKSKYLFTFNVSRDYASNFGPANRAGTFPSLSLGWKFSEEEFMKNLGFINFAKIRYGWGSTGANAKTGFPYLTKIVFPGGLKYSFDNSISLIGAGAEMISNPALKWEAVIMQNLGLDLNMLDNKLTLSAEFFTKVNDGMIMRKEVPAVAGTDGTSTYPEVNIGSLQNRGLELTIGHKNNFGDFKYSCDMNIGVVRNTILDLATDSMLKGSVHSVSPITLTKIDGSVSEFYGYKTNGLFRETDPTIVAGKKTIITNQPFSIGAAGDTTYAQEYAQPGDFRYEDTNGDGKISDADYVSLGSPLPKFTYSLNINLDYKIFDLNLFFEGSYGNKVFNGTKQYLYYSNGNGNRLAAFDNRYKKEIVKDGVVVVPANKNTDIPRLDAWNYTKPCDFFIEDASYLRLRNIQLGVTIPKSITQKVGIDRLRLYVGAKNLLTITSYEAFDPVVSGGDTNGDNGTMAMGIDIGNYPTTRMFLAGINLSF